MQSAGRNAQIGMAKVSFTTADNYKQDIKIDYIVIVCHLGGFVHRMSINRPIIMKLFSCGKNDEQS